MKLTSNPETSFMWFLSFQNKLNKILDWLSTACFSDYFLEDVLCVGRKV